jgi:hypothetical protein
MDVYVSARLEFRMEVNDSVSFMANPWVKTSRGLGKQGTSLPDLPNVWSATR